MEKWLLIGLSNCTDPSREEDFNRWYDTVHVPDVLKTPGALRATRFKNDEPQEGHWKYLAIYEVETEDIQRTTTILGEIITETMQKGLWSELLSTDLYVAFYKQMAPPVEKK